MHSCSFAQCSPSSFDLPTLLSPFIKEEAEPVESANSEGFHYSSSPPSVVVFTSPLSSPSAVCLGFVPCLLPLCQSYFFLIYAWVVAMAQYGVPCFIIPFLSFFNMLWSDWGSPNSTFIPGVSTVTLLRWRKDAQMSLKSSLESVAMALFSIEIKQHIKRTRRKMLQHKLKLQDKVYNKDKRLL